jgi:phosphate transport system permease protein
MGTDPFPANELAVEKEIQIEKRATSPPRSEGLLTRIRGLTGDGFFEILATAVGCAVIVVLALTTVVLARGSAPAWDRFGVQFVIGSEWSTSIGAEAYGALPYILGTLVTSAIAIAIGVPISLGIAIFLAEMAPGPMRAPLSQVVELLAAVPSVVYGFWGLFVFSGWIRDNVEVPLTTILGWIPIFRGVASGLDVLTAGLILAIMIIPTVSAISREVMMSVPSSQREAAYSLGATRWEVVRMSVVNYSRSGIFGAGVLGLGRAVGETMAVTMVIGNAVGPGALPTSFLKPGETLSSLIAIKFGEASGQYLIPALIGMGLILFAFAILINIFAQLMVTRVLKVTGGRIE